MNVTRNAYYSENYLDQQRRSPRNQQHETFYRPLYNNPRHQLDDETGFAPEEYYQDQGLDYQPESLYHPPTKIRNQKHGASEQSYNGHTPPESPRSKSRFKVSNILGPKSTKMSKSVRSSAMSSSQSGGSHQALSIKRADSNQSSIPKSSKTGGIHQKSPVNDGDVDSFESGELGQEITPAQLIIQQSNRVTPHHAVKRKPYEPKEAPTPKDIVGYDGYYMEQKQRYDEAVYKPKLYTHKTFRDVFQDSEESTDKYNPMEFVFDGEPKKKNFIKNVQVVLGKDNYSEYNYYDHNKKSKKKAPQEVFVKEVSDDDDEEIVYEYENANPMGDVVFEEDHKAPKKNKKLSKVFRKKMKKAKKELGKDFKNNAIKQHQIESKVKEEKEVIKKAKEEAHVEEKEEVKVDKKAEVEPQQVKETAAAVEARKVGQNPEFHPLWNYLLSWLVYETAAASNDGNAAQSKIEEIHNDEGEKGEIVKEPAVPEHEPDIASHSSPKPEPKPKKPKTTRKISLTPKNFQALKKNYKTLVSKWNEPAAMMFNDQQLVVAKSAKSSKSLVRSEVRTHRSFDPSVLQGSDDENKEFIIEYDDDSEITEELYYNPITKQLEATPPTSYSSLEPAAKSASIAEGRYMIKADGSAVTIISNINSLIKSIKIMKIIFAPIDVIAEYFPNLQTIVILIELVIFVWILYELSLLVDALCMMVKAVCAPMIAMGRFMNRIM
ncbi:uncharacterized protein RJT20DRAFT_128646 [Scheffersomyces xylosifermentans]|uniref:uncharacterized protein n=1 Tax=Scheffersomyces xylosifermentans TaxID=1304137 RepID=UPI00315DA421